MHITQPQIEAAYTTAKRVFNQELKAKEAAKFLAAEYGLNEASAHDFIMDYRYLMEGRVFHRAMSAKAMEYFLLSIFEEYKAEGLQTALVSLNAHVEYYEGHYKTVCLKMREVVRKMESLLGVQTIKELDSIFEAQVERSVSEIKSRRKRLENAIRRPPKIRIFIEVFIRNPDVVAEVLHRADGHCEGCNLKAPFLRKKDGTPYLEVHHIVMLKDGGYDVVENAIALCPNCHRQRHFGVN